ncbi:DUF2510 domain-containing protein [Mycobacterium sp. NPDC051804]|uniref:DUF2510 domain-containing protein n=1 Tax=Mycobacterium sp. NPDC051804 TaxID=3364295 RepID=UPI0037BC11BF
MAITSEQVELIARRVTDTHLDPPNKADRDVGDRMAREAAAPAVYQASCELMGAIAQQVAADEALIDVKHASGYTIAALSGAKAKVRLLVATNRRVWFSRHEDGAVQDLRAVEYPMMTIEKKRISLGWPKLEGTTVACGGSTAEWLTELKSGRHQPAPWLHPGSSSPATAPSQGGPAPNWYPDPYRRHQLRYWDGVRWTPHVSTNGVSAQDPVNQ